MEDAIALPNRHSNSFSLVQIPYPYNHFNKSVIQIQTASMQISVLKQ